MFYYIEGKLAHLDYGFAVIDAGGVGYKLTITQNTYESMPPHLSVAEAPTVRLYSYMAVREDGIELFGFASETELNAFKMLITVSGVGPKAALSILSVFTPDKLAITIMNEDTKAIAKANGIGAKTAARIILELKDKVVKGGGSDSPALFQSSSNPCADEATTALVMLGFTKANVNKAVSAVLKEKPDASLEEIIKLALKKL
jgi:Holliday junction DNA helicase RuvA